MNLNLVWTTSQVLAWATSQVLVSRKAGVHCVVLFTQDQVQVHSSLQARVGGSLRAREGLVKDLD